MRPGTSSFDPGRARGDEPYGGPLLTLTPAGAVPGPTLVVPAG
jgi:hypothetical protein